MTGNREEGVRATGVIAAALLWVCLAEAAVFDRWSAAADGAAVPRGGSPECVRCHEGDRKDLSADLQEARCSTCHHGALPRPQALHIAADPNGRPTPANRTGSTPSLRKGDMVLVPAGSFWMGFDHRHPDEEPRHQVYVAEFLIDRFEVTNAQYREFLEATGKSLRDAWPAGVFPQTLADHPMANASWFDGKAYCEWRGARLPTEAEWEKAARGVDERRFPWGNALDVRRANIAEARIGHTTPVGAFPDGRSPYGLYDMSGNVWEWTEDWYQPYPGNAEPGENYGEKYKVARGGAWKQCTFYGCGTNAPTFNRSFFSPTVRGETFGFRCARSVR